MSDKQCPTLELMLRFASSMLDPICAGNGACVIHVSTIYFGPLNCGSLNLNPDKNMEQKSGI